MSQRHEDIVEAAHNLLDAMNAAEYARGLEETQDARWEVTAMCDKLKAALKAAEEEAP